MNSIIVIGFNTFREVIRDRILYGLLVFAILLIGLSLVLGQLSYAEQTRISADFGFLAINISAIIIAVFLGSTLVSREIEQRTVYTLLAHPVSREQFLLGKFIGLFWVNLVVMLSLSCLIAVVFYFLDTPWNSDCTYTVYGIMLESLIMLAITILFGTITRPILVVAYSMGLFIIGRSIDSLNFFASKSEGEIFKALNSALQMMIPNLSKFNWSNYVLIEDKVPIPMVGWATVYAVGWLGVFVFAAAIIFRKRDFA